MRGEEKERHIYGEVGGEESLGTEVYVDDAEIRFFTEENSYTADDVASGWTTVREVLLESIKDDEHAAEDVYQQLQQDGIGIRVEAPDRSRTWVDDEQLENYTMLSGVEGGIPQSIMDHEYLDGVCNYCSADVDLLRAQPEKGDLDVYMYDCDDCGNSGHYFGGEDAEDGSVMIWTEFVEDDDLSRAISLKEGSEIAIFDLASQTTEQPHGEEIYHVEIGDDWHTRPDGLLYRVLDQPVPIPDETREILEDQMEKPNFGTAVFDPKGVSDIDYAEGDAYVKVVDASQLRFSD